MCVRPLHKRIAKLFAAATLLLSSLGTSGGIGLGEASAEPDSWSVPASQERLRFAGRFLACEERARRRAVVEFTRRACTTHRQVVVV